MAHSVEGRFPFLDHTLVEFCNNLPLEYKLMGLKEKVLLKKVASELIPEEIWRRQKNPYRAPIQHSFFQNGSPDYVLELLSPRSIEEAGYFEPRAVSALVKKILDGAVIGEIDSMALTGILSTQLVQDTFVVNFRKQPAISKTEDVKVVIRQGVSL
jgi:asparagine synthase (glutamine-hydrolysing)